MQSSIYVCCHKQGEVPQGNILKPIHVGKALSSQDLNMPGDDTKDNISVKNKHFCELTATYWIWKNCRSDIKGLFHYRRFFNLETSEEKFHKLSDTFCSDFGLTEEKMDGLMARYDVLLPKAIKNTPKKNPPTIYEHYARDHVAADMDCVLGIIKEKYPEMSDIADKVIKQDRICYCCNMLVAKKEIFDEYAAWLFGVLFEAENRIQADVLSRDAYQQRVYGFLAERMMRVFIEYKKSVSPIKVLEVPLLYWEDNPEKWRKYKIKRIKHKILNFFKLKGGTDE